jgi:hypothetical protein
LEHRSQNRSRVTSTVTCSEGGSCWKATSDECELIGEHPVTLLALAAIYETRGQAWQASDDEIEKILRQYETNTLRS